MRPASTAALTALLSGVLAVPAAAEPVPAPEAIRTISAACLDSQVALLAGGSVTTSTTRLALTPQRFQVGGVSIDRVVAADAGTYGAITASGLRMKDRKKALGYLKRPRARWWVNAGRFETPAQGWSASFEQARDAVLTIPESCSEVLQSVSGDSVDLTGNTWTFTGASHDPITILSTGDGRLSQLADMSIDYSVPALVVPSRAVPFRAWQKASQAASLDRVLRTLAKQVAGVVNSGEPTVPAIEEAAGAALQADRVVPIKVRQLRKGSLLYARNPYTKAYHAWRVYLKKGRAVARRVAP
ncbi:MAG: hypothetical protein R2720_07580 [Candidatus Nanopelagicales bacterium]